MLIPAACKVSLTRVERHEGDRCALGGADGRVRVVHLQANRVFAGDHPIEHRADRDGQRNGSCLASCLQVGHSLLLAHVADDGTR